MLAPVGPVPATFAVKDEAILTKLPKREILPNCRISIDDGLLISAIPIVSPKPLPTDTGKHLLGQLVMDRAVGGVQCSRFANAGWDGRIKNMIGALPASEFVNTFFHDEWRTDRLKCIERLAEFIGHIAPPLGAFAVWAIHVAVPHRYIKRAAGFIPELVETRVARLEATRHLSVVASLAIFQIQHFYPGGNFVMNLVTIEPIR